MCLYRTGNKRAGRTACAGIQGARRSRIAPPLMNKIFLAFFTKTGYIQMRLNTGQNNTIQCLEKGRLTRRNAPEITSPVCLPILKVLDFLFG